jgi:flagellar protein FliS
MSTMMIPTRGAEQYRQMQVRSRTPLELVVMLYDSAIRSMAAASEAAARRDLRARRDALSHAQAVLVELQSTLDLERGGAIAAELDRLYTYAFTRLTDAVVERSNKPIDEARAVIETLADAWRTIAAAPAAEAPR